MNLSQYQVNLAKALGLLTATSTQKAANPIDTNAIKAPGGTVGIKDEMPTEFIDLMVDQTTLLKAVRVHRTDSPSGDLAKIDVTTNITESATENTTSTETRKHTPSSVNFVNKKLRSQFDITTEVEEDNIEGSSGVSTILASLMKAVMNDVEILSIQGDASEGGASDYARLIKANDGYSVLTAAGTGTHQLNAANGLISWRLLSDMIGNLPTRYRVGNWKSNYKFIMSPNTLLRLMNEAETRATGLGDGAWQGNMFAPLGIQVMEVPHIPENLSASGTDSTGTFIWLMNPKNFIYVLQRDLKVHSEFIPRYDRTEITVFKRCDFIVENTDAIVKATNVLTDPDAALYGA